MRFWRASNSASPAKAAWGRRVAGGGEDHLGHALWMGGGVGRGDQVSEIKKVSRGETVLGSPVASRLVAELARSSVPEGDRTESEPEVLSEREIEVTRLVGQGATTAEIADELYISEGTAKNNVSKILRKLGPRDRTQLALYAARRWPQGPQ